MGEIGAPDDLNDPVDPAVCRRDQTADDGPVTDAQQADALMIDAVCLAEPVHRQPDIEHTLNVHGLDLVQVRTVFQNDVIDRIQPRITRRSFPVIG